MGSKGWEVTREFYKATDEEIAQAAKECRRMIARVAKEEKPNKDRICQEVYRWAKENGIENDSPYKTYLTHEWPEKKYIREYLRRRLAEVPVEVPQDPDLSMEYLRSRNSPTEHEPGIPDRLITDSVHFKDCTGESLLIKVNAGVEDCFEGTQKPMHKHILEAMNRLESSGDTAPIPANVDNRHPTNNYRIAKKYWNSKGQPCGVYHFACWRQKGRAHDQWSTSGPWNHTLSRDILKSPQYKFGFRIRFLSDVAPLQQTMSLWHEVVDKKRYLDYRQQVDFLAKEDTGMEAIKFSQDHSFLGMAVLWNV